MLIAFDALEVHGRSGAINPKSNQESRLCSE